MKKLAMTVSMGLALFTAAPISAFCANAAISAFCASADRVAPGPQSGDQVSFANPSAMVLAQAATETSVGSADPSVARMLISHGLLTPGSSAPDSPVSADDTANISGSNPTTAANTAFDDHEKEKKCKKGESEKDEKKDHCEESPSE